MTAGNRSTEPRRGSGGGGSGAARFGGCRLGRGRFRSGKKSRERRAHRALGAHPLMACNDWTSPDVWVPSAEARLAIARAARLPHRAARLPRRFRACSCTNAGSHRIGSASWANYSHSVSQLTLRDSDKIPSLRLD